MARAQRGDSEPGHRPLQGRHDHQDPRPHRRARQAGALRPLAGAPVRHGGHRAADLGCQFGGLIGDKAFDSNALIAELDERGAKVVIAQHPRRTRPLDLDREMSRWRHLIENFFCKLKEFKRIAMRSDKTDQSFSAMIHRAAAVINSR
jgi:transposase